MAFSASCYRNGSGTAPRSAVRMDNRTGTSTSISKIERSSSSASSPQCSKSVSLSPSIGSGGRRNSLTSSRGNSEKGGPSGRVRVAVRLRPRNAEEKLADTDFADCVELQPEMKGLKLRKNNWECDTYQFDDVLTETSSQKRVYEVVAKPVVESVCEGYNGTVMAYGQTGTGKTFTLGRLGGEDHSERGIMVRALEDILTNLTSVDDTVTVSYLQLYMEKVQDLLAPEKENLAIVEDPQSRDIFVPTATQVELRDQLGIVQLLQAGEANRLAANTKMNTESSRGHAILVVNVKRVVDTNIGDGEQVSLNKNGGSLQMAKRMQASIVRKSKLLIVDLAGSERVEKSGSEGHLLQEAKSINLSLTALGKCINALAENALHVPVRDSKLTRMLSDSFGGTARSSLVLTIGPSPCHKGETASTVAFGQRVMKVENMVKMKEVFDYKSLCQKFERELDRLLAENERLLKGTQGSREDFQRRFQATQEIVHAGENSRLASEQVQKKESDGGLGHATQLGHSTQLLLERDSLESSDEVQDLKTKLQKETQLKKKLEHEVRFLKLGLGNSSGENHDQEILLLKGKLVQEFEYREILEEEVRSLKERLMLLGDLCYSTTMGTCFGRSLESADREYKSGGSQSPSLPN